MTDPIVSTVDNTVLDKVLAAVEQAAQAAQNAAQVAQQASQAIDQISQKFTQTAGTVVSGQEIGDVGGTENIEADLISKDKAWFANAKRTYDEYQHESLESIKRNRTHVDVVLSNAEANNQKTEAVKIQALQNAVETANMVGKQAVRHGDIAIDGQWNPVQQGAGDTLTARSVSIDDASLKAISAAIAAAVANALAPKAA